MTDAEKIEKARELLQEALRLINDVDGRDNDHLLAYAGDSVISAVGYLETFEHRLADPEAD